MRKLRSGILLGAFVLFGCDHHKPANQAQAEAGSAAVVRNDSDLTGMPPVAQPASKPVTYPRALPVSLPEAAPSSGAKPATGTAASIPSSSEANPEPAPETSSASTSPTPAESSKSEPAAATDANTDMTRLAINPPTPSVAPPPVVDEAEGRKQVVVLDTSFGRIVIQLDDVAAPRTCGNFRRLVSSGFYNHTTFHRVIPNFMIQGGDPNSKTDDRSTYGQGDPGYTLAAEIKLKAVAGAVAMARLPDSVNPQRNSNGSQFFIYVADCPSLNDQYTVFGHVLSGMDVANKIANQPRDKRDDPTDRIEIDASLESKKLALEQSTATP